MVKVIQGEGGQALKEARVVERALAKEIGELKLPAFPRAILAANAEEAIPILLQSYGLGPLRANTVLLNWLNRASDDTGGLKKYGDWSRIALRYNCNVVILDAEAKDFEKLDAAPHRKRVIDVWYRENATGRLMLLLAYLMTRVKSWRDAQLRLFAAPNGKQSPEECRAELEQMLDEVRIVAEPVIVKDVSPQTVYENSGSSSFVFIPFRLTEGEPRSVSGDPLNDYVSPLGLVALTLARQDMVLDADPEAGEYAEVAEAVDKAEQAQKTAVKVEKQAAKVTKEADKARRKVEKAEAAGDQEQLPELEHARSAAEEDAERSRRRVAKARAKADDATREAEELTGTGPPDDSSTEEPTKN